MRLLVVLVVAALVAAGCGDDEPVATDDGPGGARLASEYVSVAVTDDGEDRPLVPGTEIRLTFDAGRVGASLGCNLLGATYRLDGDVLVIDELATTDMGCDSPRHAQDEWFADLLAGRPTLAADGDLLTITSGTTVVVLRDREVVEPDRELVGTTWEVTGFLEGTGPDGTASSTADDDPGTLELRDDGLVVGSDGCNGFGYATDDAGVVSEGLRYEVDGDRITFTGALVSRMRACPELEDHVERVRAVLEGTATWEIDADRLTLVAGDGRGVTYRAVEA